MDINSLIPLLNNLIGKRNCNNCNHNNSENQAQIQTEVLNTYPNTYIDDSTKHRNQQATFKQSSNNNTPFYPQNNENWGQTNNFGNNNLTNQNSSNQSNNWVSSILTNNNQQNSLSMLSSILGNGSFDLSQLGSLLSNNGSGGILSMLSNTNTHKEAEKKNSPKISEFVKIDEHEIADY